MTNALALSPWHLASSDRRRQNGAYLAVTPVGFRPTNQHQNTPRNRPLGNGPGQTDHDGSYSRLDQNFFCPHNGPDQNASCHRGLRFNLPRGAFSAQPLAPGGPPAFQCCPQELRSYFKRWFADIAAPRASSPNGGQFGPSIKRCRPPWPPPSVQATHGRCPGSGKSAVR